MGNRFYTQIRIGGTLTDDDIDAMQEQTAAPEGLEQAEGLHDESWRESLTPEHIAGCDGEYLELEINDCRVMWTQDLLETLRDRDIPYDTLLGQPPGDVIRLRYRPDTGSRQDTLNLTDDDPLTFDGTDNVVLRRSFIESLIDDADDLEEFERHLEANTGFPDCPTVAYQGATPSDEANMSP